jgi:AraC family transcriptional regulator of adaptative response / DNA-3-methyladenine glycosylase II
MDLDADRCYRALLSRDRRFDGRFFIGVTTTGIYCRPICPSPPPRQRNVRFFACAAAAQAEGFRPCLRCRPESAPGTPAWEGSPALVRRALRLIAQGKLDEDDVESFAAHLGVGGRHLRRLFETHLGASPAAVARASRAHFARKLLDESDLKMADIALSAGFRGVRQFNQVMRATFKASPRELRAKRRGAPGQAGGLAIRLFYRPPLDWDALHGFLALRATPGIEVFDERGYRRTFRAGAAAGTLSVAQDRAGNCVRLVLRLPALGDLQAVVARVRRLFDLDADPLRIGRQLARSPELAARVRARPGLRVPGAWDGFELAVRAVLGQQVSVRGATTLAGRLVARFGEPLPAPAEAGLTHLFPEPAALADADVAAIGLPRARAASIRALAGAVAKGKLPLDGGLELSDLVVRLCEIPGIGAWTAHYIAMRACGETDAFPAGDLGLRRAFANDGRGPASERTLLAASEAWRPFRAYAAMHLWTSPRAIPVSRAHSRRIA